MIILIELLCFVRHLILNLYLLTLGHCFLTMLCIMWSGLLLKTFTSALCILWMLMSWKQVCCLAVYSCGFLGLWIPLCIDDTGINLFIQAHLWKIHVCSKGLSLWTRIGGHVSTHYIVYWSEAVVFKTFFRMVLSICQRRNEGKPLVSQNLLGKFDWRRPCLSWVCYFL